MIKWSRMITRYYVHFSVTSSLPTNLGAPQGAKPAPQLPSYTQCVPDGYEWEGEEGQGQEEEGQMDENERIALQEAEDERIARELMQNEESEVREGGMEGGRGRKE